jgi:hypothetical protein
MAHDDTVSDRGGEPRATARERVGDETVGRPRPFRPWLNAGSIRASADHLVGVGVGHIEMKIGNPTFRTAGITAYLENGGALEKAATLANHGSASTMLSWWRFDLAPGAGGDPPSDRVLRQYRVGRRLY